MSEPDPNAAAATTVAPDASVQTATQGAVVPYFAATALPQDWRSQLIPTDLPEKDSVAKWLERYGDPVQAVVAGFRAQEVIRKGETSRGLPANPTPDQLTAWREANNVPLEVSGYQYQPVDGLVLGDADEQVLAEVYPIAHAAGVNRVAMQDMVAAFLKVRNLETQQRQMLDNQESNTATQLLRSTWKGDFDRNLNMSVACLAGLPEAVRESFENARMPDGTAVMNTPEVLVWLSDLQRKIDPAATVVPGASNPMQTIEDEIAAIEKRIGDETWYRDVAAQKRYQELLNTRSKLKAA